MEFYTWGRCGGVVGGTYSSLLQLVAEALLVGEEPLYRSKDGVGLQKCCLIANTQSIPNHQMPQEMGIPTANPHRFALRVSLCWV